MDFVSPEKRSRIMRGSRSKNTKPEMAVRSVLRDLGYGYRLHRKDLPGKPDLAFIGRKKAIFVHGCFWHQHDDPRCKISRRPDSNLDFWNDKFQKNQERDRKHERMLVEAGWEVMTVWECELAAEDELSRKLDAFLQT